MANNIGYRLIGGQLQSAHGLIVKAVLLGYLNDKISQISQMCHRGGYFDLFF